MALRDRRRLVHGRLQLPEHEPFGGRLHQPVERDGRCRWRQHESDSRHTALAGEQHGGRAEPPGRFMCESRCGSRADEQRTRRCPPIAERNDQLSNGFPVSSPVARARSHSPPVEVSMPSRGSPPSPSKTGMTSRLVSSWRGSSEMTLYRGAAEAGHPDIIAQLRRTQLGRPESR